MERVMRRATTAVPRSARPIAAPSAISTAVHVPLSRRAASACAATIRMRGAAISLSRLSPTCSARILAAASPQAQGADAVAALEERLLLSDDVPVLFKRCAGLLAVHCLRSAQWIFGKAREIVGHPLRQLCPRLRIVPVAQHQCTRLKPQEWRNRIPGGRGDGEGGDALGWGVQL